MAIAIPSEEITARPISPPPSISPFTFTTILLNTIASNITKKIAPNIGSKPSNTAKAIPPKAPCPMLLPNKDKFLNTNKTPNRAPETPKKKPTSNALPIYSYPTNSNMFIKNFLGFGSPLVFLSKFLVVFFYELWSYSPQFYSRESC